MRSEPSILHVDLDAMFAAVEQRDKVSLRGRPVVVGGVAGRGVVATASYEARAYGVRSAMPMAQARRRCPPGTAYLSPRFAAYKRTSEVVMTLLAGVSPLVEQVSIDEAYLDLAVAGHDLTPRGVTELALRLKSDIAVATGGVTGSVGVASSKLLAKIGSELNKPDGLTVVPAGDELTVLHPLPVNRLGGVGPATEQRLHRSGVRTIGDLARVALEDLVDWFGQAHGGGLFRLARADDSRPVVGEREAKSVSAEETFEVDLTDMSRLNRELDLLSARVAGRLRAGGITGRTVNIKVRHHDFTTVTRALTRDQPTDDARLVAQLARRLLAEIDTSGGIRLLGVGVSTLADFAQDDLFTSFLPLSEGGPTPLAAAWGDPDVPRGSGLPADLANSGGSSVSGEPDPASVAEVTGSGASLTSGDPGSAPVTADSGSASSSGKSLASDALVVTVAGPVGGSDAVPADARSIAPQGASAPGSAVVELAVSAEGAPEGAAFAGSVVAGEDPSVSGSAVVSIGAPFAAPVASAGGASFAASSAVPENVPAAGEFASPAVEIASADVSRSAAAAAATVEAPAVAPVGAMGLPGGAGESRSLAGGLSPETGAREEPVWRPGQDVWHDDHGAGWVWGSGLGRVTVRFEGPHTPPGPVRTFAAADPHLHPADPPDWTTTG